MSGWIIDSCQCSRITIMEIRYIRAISDLLEISGGVISEIFGLAVWACDIEVPAEFVQFGGRCPPPRHLWC